MKIIIVLCLLTTKVYCQQIDTIIPYPNGKYFTKGEFDIKNKKRIGTWQLFNIENELISTITSYKPPFWKVTPAQDDSSIINYYYGYFRKDTIVLHGEFYYEGYSRITKGTFKDGSAYGIWENYENNKLIGLTHHNEEQEQSFFFDKQGEITFIQTYKNNIIDGLYIKFEGINKIEEIGNFENKCKVGEWSYYKNGILESRGYHYPEYLSYSQTLDGKYVLVNKDTILAEKLYSKQIIEMFDEKENQLYFKDGKWDYFYDDGSIMKVEFYNKGRLTKVKKYKKGRYAKCRWLLGKN